MNMRTTTLENGMWAVVQDRPSAPGKAASSGFAAQLSRATQAAQADQADGGELKAAYDRLSAASKAVLNRLKAGEANVSKEEWAALRRELRDAGLITQEEFFRSDPDVVVVGYTDANGELVTYPPVCCQGAAQSNGGVLISRYWSPEDWAGDPLRFLDKWLEAIREWQDEVDAQYRADGTKYDMSHLTKQAEEIGRAHV